MLKLSCPDTKLIALTRRLTDNEKVPRNMELVNMPLTSVIVSRLLGGTVNLIKNDADESDSAALELHNVKMLVVDDIDINLMIAEEALLHYGGEVDTADSGAKAIELIKKNNYDIVFMDHMMPEMDGVDVTKIIRAMPDKKYKSLIIVALTANVVGDVRDLFLECGMNDFISKPLEFGDMEEVLKKWLPQEKWSYSQPSEKSRVLTENDGAKILVVDDSRLNQALLCRILENDYTLVLADSGPEALKKVVDDPPDLILLDIIMPGMDGYEVLTELKNNDKTRDIPVIVITGLSRAEDEVKGLVLGAADYITKPFYEVVVKARVDTHLKIASQLRKIEQLGSIDTTTNISNRRLFVDNMIGKWEFAKREKFPISVLMISVDRFEDYNHTYGRENGDFALKTIAGVIKSSLSRPDDVAARWDREKFSVLLPNTSLGDAVITAEIIRKNVESMELVNDLDTPHRLTVSIGVASIKPSDDSKIEDVIRLADNAMKHVKDTDCNRVKF